MNIFFLSESTSEAAAAACDRHVVKMITETCQMLSTAHRVLDGTEYIDKTKNGRKIKRWKLEDSGLDDLLMKASHVNHPCNIWVRSHLNNYQWLRHYGVCLLREYNYRYNKPEKFARAVKILNQLCPSNISIDTIISPYLANINFRSIRITEPPLTMPDQYKVKAKRNDQTLNHIVESYRRFYIEEKASFATWTKRSPPEWFPYKIK